MLFRSYNFLQLTVKDAKTNIANQILHIDEFINDNYDFIITSPIDPHLTPMVLKKAIDKGIKVILLDRGISTKDYSVFITPDNKTIAKSAAEYLLKEMNYKGTILMLQGLDKATPTIEREKSFEEVAKKYKNIKIIKARGNYLRVDTIIALEELYSKNLTFDAIYSHSDSMLVGAREVMKRTNKDLTIPAVGIDYIKDAQQAIISGTQKASFTYPTCGKEGVEAIVAIIKGKQVPCKNRSYLNAVAGNT